MTRIEQTELLFKVGLLTMKEFKSLTRDLMYRRLKADFPEEAMGKSRTKKDDLIEAYLWELTGRPKELPIPTNIEDPKELPTPADIEEMRFPKEIEKIFGPLNPDRPVPNTDETKVEAQVRLPVRSHADLRFVICEGDPNRPLTNKEEAALEKVAKLLPTLGPKFQTEPKGVPGRRVFDPHKENRKVVRNALKQLDWGKIMILRDDQITTEKPRLGTLSENM